MVLFLPKGLRPHFIIISFKYFEINFDYNNIQGLNKVIYINYNDQIMVKSIISFWGYCKLNFLKKPGSFKIKSNMELNSWDGRIIKDLINKGVAN